MSTDPEEARSDLLLSGAVYVFGPILFNALRFLEAVPVLGAVLDVIRPLVLTILVPVLLARYRGEGPSRYGLSGRARPTAGLGLLLALPIVAAALAGPALAGRLPSGILPAVALNGSAVDAAANLATWVGLTGLALYATVKARDAFRSPLYGVRAGVLEVGRVLGIAGGSAVLLLLVAARGAGALDALFPVLGVALAVVLLHRAVRGPGSTTRMTLVAPVLLLALAPLNPLAALFAPDQFLVGVYVAALIGAVGLLVAGSLEGRRSGWPAVALGVALGLFVPASLIG